MRIAFLILCLLFAPISYSKGKGAKPKIITREIGERDVDSWVFNSEINQYQDATYLNPSITYSSKYNLDISISSQNIPVWKNGVQTFQDDTYFILSKIFRLDNDNDLVIGSQNGYSLYSPDGGKISPGKMHQFYYSTHVTKVNDWLKVSGGSYYVNSALSTTTNYFGGTAGFEAKWNDIIFKGDYVGGHTNISGAVLSIGYFLTNWFNPYVGISVPETKSGNEFYGIIGFTISDKSLKN